MTFELKVGWIVFLFVLSFLRNLYNNQLTTLPVDGDFHNRRIDYL